MHSSTRKLRVKHNYKRFADSCKNCRHFKTDSAYGGVDGIWADSCHVDAGVFLEDGHTPNPDQEVHILHNPWGVCDKHERTGVRRDDN